MSFKIQFHGTDFGLHELKDMVNLLLSDVVKYHHPSHFKVAHFIDNNSSYNLSQDIVPAKAELKGYTEISWCTLV